MNNPLVSVIVPTYNRVAALAELAESLSRQTVQDMEVIIVNDGGEKVEIVRELYPDLDITILEMNQNSKHVEARNRGVKAARGRYIMLMDDDDLLVPTHLETMLGEMDGVDLAYADVEIINYQLEKGTRVPISRLLFAYTLDLEAMRSFSTYVPSGSLYRKELHDELGLFDVAVHNYWDWDFFLRVADCHQIKRVPIASVLYEFSDTGNNQSKDLSARSFYLDKLSKKHNLGPLPTENFFTLLEKPEIRERKAKSKLVWDGKPFISRLALMRKEN